MWRLDPAYRSCFRDGSAINVRYSRDGNSMDRRHLGERARSQHRLLHRALARSWEESSPRQRPAVIQQGKELICRRSAAAFHRIIRVSTPSDIKVSPKEIAFGTRTVGKDHFDGVKITNTSGRTLRVLVVAGLPDDFGFGFMPGSTCPVLTPGELMADGASCRAVVRFTPTEFFVGRQQTSELTVTATDPETGAFSVTVIPVSGTGKN